MEIDWPIKSKTVTYVIGSHRTIALFEKNKDNAKTFIKDLRKLDDLKVRRSVKFVADYSATDEYLYVVDFEGLQVVIQIERDDDPIDISKYDA
jgi:hypothetical protein